MSHKIYKNVAAKQQAYRDREKAKKQAAWRASLAAAGDHDNHQQPDPVCLLCNPHTVTQSQREVMEES
jgi:hypothetical protein